MTARFSLSLLVLLTSLLAHSVSASVPFTISVVQKQLTEQSGGTTFTILAGADSGFTASIFLRASSPTLAQSAFTFSRPRFDHPYTSPVQLTVQTDGAVGPGIHVIVVEGFNGSVVATDTCNLIIAERSGWTVYTTQNSALPTNVIRSIQLDDQGVAWMATDNGVVRFDGDTMQSYLSDRIASLALQNGTTPWVLQNSSLWRMVEGEFREFNHSAISDQPQILCAGRGGEIWVYMRSTHKLARIIGDEVAVFEIGNLVSGNMWAAVTSMIVDRSNTLWLGFSGYNREWIVTYDGQYWTAYERSRFQLSDFQGSSQLVLDPTLGIWSVSQDGLVHVRTDGSTSYPSNPTGVFPGFMPTAFAIDSLHGHRWVGVTTTANHPSQPVGLARFTPNGLVLYQSSNSPLPAAGIFALRADKSGKLWAATSNGLVVIDVSAIGSTVSAGETDFAKRESSPATIIVTPNPIDTRAVIQLKGWPENEAISVVVRSVTGEVVHQIYHGAVTTTTMEFVLSAQSLANGYYMLHVQGQLSSAAVPLVVHH